MPVVPAEGALLEEIIDLTSPIWSEGLSRAGYAQWNAAQTKTAWGRGHLQRVALVDEAGRLQSTAKQYRFDVRLNGRDGWMCGIGAVFTPPERRGRGYAARLITALVDEARRNGALIAGLFSEIGAETTSASAFATFRSMK